MRAAFVLMRLGCNCAEQSDDAWTLGDCSVEEIVGLCDKVRRLADTYNITNAPPERFSSHPTLQEDIVVKEAKVWCHTMFWSVMMLGTQPEARTAIQSHYRATI